MEEARLRALEAKAREAEAERRRLEAEAAARGMVAPEEAARRVRDAESALEARFHEELGKLEAEADAERKRREALEAEVEAEREERRRERWMRQTSSPWKSIFFTPPAKSSSRVADANLTVADETVAPRH